MKTFILQTGLAVFSFALLYLNIVLWWTIIQ